MTCPRCGATDRIVKKGSFSRKTGPLLRVRRFFCKSCRRYSSQVTNTIFERQKRPELDREVYLLVNSGVSQRRTAKLLRTTQTTVARKIVRVAKFARAYQSERNQQLELSVNTAVFDEMETFEHSKCKPLVIAVAVQEGSRRIIAAHVSKMPAKGRLAAIARKKYGYRPDHRRRGLARVLTEVATVRAADLVVKSDQCPRYPKAVRRHLPGARHVTFKGRRACVVGQGELKAGGFDPLFSLNHTCAMFRDNLKRLTRKTWCTTKRPDRLQCLVDLYVCAHNDIIDHQLGTKALPPRSLFQLPER